MCLMKTIKMYVNNSYIQYNALLLKYSCAWIHNILYYKEKKNNENKLLHVHCKKKKKN